MRRVHQPRPVPPEWPTTDMVQKRRVDRKSWHVQFAVGQVVELCRNKVGATMHRTSSRNWHTLGAVAHSRSQSCKRWVEISSQAAHSWQGDRYMLSGIDVIIAKTLIRT